MQNRVNIDISRRSFLKYAGTTLLGATALPLSGCSLTCPLEDSQLSRTIHPITLNEVPPIEPWASVLSIARRTPSPHNVQPWRLRIYGEKHADLLLDNSRLVPVEDPTGAFIVSSLGMFSDACCLVGKNQGLNIAFQKDLNLDRTAPFSRIGRFEIVKGTASVASFSNDLFLNRRTSRLHLASEIVESDVLNRLKKIASDARHDLHYISDPELISRILDLTIQTVVDDMNDCGYNREITRWFRYSEQDELIHKDGLSSRCMALSPRQFRLFAESPGLARWPIVGPIIRSNYRNSFGGAPQIGILCGDFFEPSIAFEVGRMFMRLWLEMASHEIYLHPFGNLVTNTQARARLIELTGVSRPWLVFRFGHSAIPPESLRLDSPNLCI